MCFRNKVYVYRLYKRLREIMFIWLIIFFIWIIFIFGRVVLMNFIIVLNECIVGLVFCGCLVILVWFLVGFLYFELVVNLKNKNRDVFF